MLEVSATVLLIAWLLGTLSSYTLGGSIHLLLALALVLIAVRVLRRPRSAAGRNHLRH